MQVILQVEPCSTLVLIEEREIDRLIDKMNGCRPASNLRREETNVAEGAVTRANDRADRLKRELENERTGLASFLRLPNEGRRRRRRFRRYLIGWFQCL